MFDMIYNLPVVVVGGGITGAGRCGRGMCCCCTGGQTIPAPVSTKNSIMM
jgi:hypothetical protein